jgi:hypothetical protein
MANSDLVRASRDGDQFHYLWAARRCLLLLSSDSRLESVTIEGVQASDLAEGEELIDVAEYYRAEKDNEPERVTYIQCKHSTLQRTKTWTPSELKKTLSKFAERFLALQEAAHAPYSFKEFEFVFLSNRPMDSDFLEAVKDIASGGKPKNPKLANKLKSFTKLDGASLADFCRHLRLDGDNDDYWGQRNSLVIETSKYLPGLDSDAPFQLKELVSRKATSEGTNNKSITKFDVLRALQVDEDKLFPAPCQIESIESFVPRSGESSLFQRIKQAHNSPTVVHAEGGVGKSVFSRRLFETVPRGSCCILYDCFANGRYQIPSAYRHAHNIALVQIVNELAAKGLCDPLIPSSHADLTDYFKVFQARIKQSVASLRAKDSEAILYIVLDAADNAELAAQDAGEPRSFVRPLMRETIPDGVRLVVTCRTHRQQLLEPPPATLFIELPSFDVKETSLHLRQFFPDATDVNILEFHTLSSQNPRVQAFALNRNAKSPLADILKRLGPNPTTVEDTLNVLLSDAIKKIKHETIGAEKEQIDRICEGLATLRPRIPIAVLAKFASVEESAIRSFIIDFDRPLLVANDSIQFRDEPAETWFRETFRPKPAALGKFIEDIRPLAKTNVYVAEALPRLMFEADRFAELVQMALHSEDLPDNSPLQRREIEAQRLQFALKACLRKKQYADAAKLALKAGGSSAGQQRELQILQSNTDITGVLLDADNIRTLVSRRLNETNWRGSHFAYESVLLAASGELGEAGSKLRVAERWLKDLYSLPKEERDRLQDRPSFDDIAELAMAYLRIHGSKRCVQFLSSWTPRRISFCAGLRLARKLVDLQRYTELDDIAIDAGDDMYLALAIAKASREVNRNPPKAAMKSALKRLRIETVEFRDLEGFHNDESEISAVVAVVEARLGQKVGARALLVDLLERYLPPTPSYDLSSPHSLRRTSSLSAYALLAELKNEPLELLDLAYPSLRSKLEKSSLNGYSQEERQFKEVVAPLLAWHKVVARQIVSGIPDKDYLEVIEKTIQASAPLRDYGHNYHPSGEIATLWLKLLANRDNLEPDDISRFEKWADALPRPLSASALSSLSRFASRITPLCGLAIRLNNKAVKSIEAERDDALQNAQSYVELARAIFPINREEAAALLDKAITVSGRFGDETRERWAAICSLSKCASSDIDYQPELAYKVARCAEVVREYAGGDKYFDWSNTVQALACLCPPSSLAVLSRWRDRQFGTLVDLLPEVIEAITKRKALRPCTALALMPFRFRWNESQLLDRALDECKSLAEKKIAVNFALRYMLFTEGPCHRKAELKSLLIRHGLIAEDFEKFGLLGEKPQPAPYAANWAVDVSENSAPDAGYEWVHIFDDIDLSTNAGVQAASQRFAARPAPRRFSEFLDEACKRVIPGGEARFVSALSSGNEFCLTRLRTFISQIPEAWDSFQSVCIAVTGAIKRVCRRDCIAAHFYSSQEDQVVVAAKKYGGLEKSDLIDEVLSALGETSEVFDQARLFSLVSMLAAKLRVDEARDALGSGLALFEEQLNDTDGDGPWSEDLLPPADTEAALAGYLWGSLASPIASERWEAAHAVRSMCLLGQHSVLDHLLDLAKTSKGGPFVDRKLFFYNLHANQWLLLALSRAALEVPAEVNRFRDFLMQSAFGSSTHVVTKELAGRALLLVMDGEGTIDDDELRRKITQINKSPFPHIRSKNWERARNLGYDGIDSEFAFDIDADQDWFSPLGRCFDIANRRLRRMTEEVVREQFKYPGLRPWQDDERARRSFFSSTSGIDSRDVTRKVDDLRSYFQYHAVMIVAGQLLSTLPVHIGLDETLDDFTLWLGGHGLTCADGRWLADRRDPSPIRPVDNAAICTREHWPWSIAKGDFEARLLGGLPDVVVWAHWLDNSGLGNERVFIRSALVSSATSEALLRATQAADVFSYGIPAAGQDLEIKDGSFELQGWISDGTSRTGLDLHDPWGGDLRFPGARPCDEVIQLMGIHESIDRRYWIQGQQRIMSLEVWGEYDERRASSVSHGERLRTSLDFIREFLAKKNMDMIVKVQIERVLERERYGKTNSQEIGYIPPSCRLFLFKADGRIQAT